MGQLRRPGGPGESEPRTGEEDDDNGNSDDQARARQSADLQPAATLPTGLVHPTTVRDRPPRPARRVAARRVAAQRVAAARGVPEGLSAPGLRRSLSPKERSSPHDEPAGPGT